MLTPLYAVLFDVHVAPPFAPHRRAPRECFLQHVRCSVLWQDDEEDVDTASPVSSGPSDAGDCTTTATRAQIALLLVGIQ